MSKSKMTKKQTAEPPALLKLDLGCGKNKAEGFLGIDQRAFSGVDATTDFSRPGKWTFVTRQIGGVSLDAHTVGHGHPDCWTLPDSSVEAIHCSHFLEHLTGLQRVQFFNEMHRVLVPGGRVTIITPHWASNRAYGDFTHQWPPVSEMLFYYVRKEWRIANAPDNDIEWNPHGYSCDFEATWGYGMHPELMHKNTDFQTFAMTWYKEAVQDTHATLTARK